MKFKKDVYFVTVCGYAPEFGRLAKDLCDALVGMFIEDNPENYGRHVAEAMGDTPAGNVAAYLRGFFGANFCIGLFNAFCKLTVLGEGDCPDCGGNLVCKEVRGHELKDGDFYTPNSWVIDLYVYECPICGKTIKTTTEL